MKRMLSLFVILLALLCTTCSVFASYELNTTGVDPTLQFEALDSRWILDSELNSNKELLPYYAGVYINIDNVLVICVTGNVDDFKSSMGNANVIYRLVDHNLEKLERTNAEVIKLLGEYGIRSVTLDHVKNRIVVGLGNRDDIEKIMDVIDCSAILFEDVNPNILLMGTANILNGNPGGLSLGSSGMGFSVGMKAKSNATGKVGVLIPGHAYPNSNANVYYNSGTGVIGQVRQWLHAGAVDAAFVETNSNYTPTKSFMNGDTYGMAAFSLSPGQSVSQYGMSSGKTAGVVLALSCSGTANFSVGSVSFTNLVKCSYVTLLGDSGGPVAAWYEIDPRSGYREWAVMGLQSISALSNSGNWVNGQSFSLFSRIDNIASNLNLNINP